MKKSVVKRRVFIIFVLRCNLKRKAERLITCSGTLSPMIEVGDDDNLAISTEVVVNHSLPSLIRFLQNFEYVELWRQMERFKTPRLPFP